MLDEYFSTDIARHSTTQVTRVFDRRREGSPCVTLCTAESAAAAALPAVSLLGSPMAAGISRCLTGSPGLLCRPRLEPDDPERLADELGGQNRRIVLVPATSKIPRYQPR